MFTRDYLTAVATNLMVCTFGQMLFCTMPVLISGKGYHPSYAGLMVYAFSFASVCFRPFTGWLATLVSGRKTVGACLGAFALTCVALYLSPPLWAVVALRAVQGIIMCMYGTIFGTLVSNLIAPQRFAEGMGYYSMGVPAMSFFGPAIGLTLLQNLGERGMFLLLCGWMAIAAMLCLSLRTGGAPVSPPLPPGQKNIFARSFAKDAVFYSAMLALILVSHSSLVSFFSLYAEQQGQGGITSFYVVAGCGIVLSRLLFTFGGRLIKAERLLFPAVAVLGFCVLLLSNMPQRPILLLLAALYGCAMGVVQPGLIALALASCSEDRRAPATATYYLGIDLGTGIGGLLWGAVASASGYHMVFALAAGVNLLTLLIMGIRRFVQKKGEASEAHAPSGSEATQHREA